MQFQITSVGLAAAFAASNNGPEIKIGQFAVGSGVGYVPLVTDSALRGVELHRDTPTNYRVIGSDTCEFTIRMSETVGTWQFGEIGLYLVTGELFALGTLQRPQWKVAYPDADFNRYNVRIRLTINGAIPKIELVVQNITVGLILEVPTVDDLPLLVNAQGNAYLCHSRDEQGNEAFATLGDNRWTVHSHMRRRYRGAVTAVNSFGTQVTGTGIGLTDATLGRYLIQFLSGSAKGAVRRIASLNVNQVNWTLPETNIAVGDQFELLQSSTGGESSGGDEAFFYSLLGR
jgi:hypothetical protein